LIICLQFAHLSLDSLIYFFIFPLPG